MLAGAGRNELKRQAHPNTFSFIGVFLLPVADALIQLLDRKNVGILAAYDDLRGGPRLFTANTGQEFVRQAKTFRKTNIVFVVTAKATANLPDLDWERTKEEVRLAISTAKQRCDKSFLNELSNLVRSTGAKRGRKPDRAARRRIVENLKRHLEGSSDDLRRDRDVAIGGFKSTQIGKWAALLGSDRDRALTKEDRAAILAAVAFHKQTRATSVSKGRSQSARRSELCWDAFQLSVLFGEPQIDQSLPEAETAAFEELGFRLPAEFGLLQQAIEIGSQQLHPG